jgi:pyruvate,water dikinase
MSDMRHGSTYILPLSSPDATLERAGGKGANLAALARAGFAVPPGFVLTTDAYRAFLAANGLASWVVATAEAADARRPDELEAASDAIRERFAAGTLPPDVASALEGAYDGLDRLAVAVRSSATAEDLPGLSFAGQQDTLLNVRGHEALINAVVRCWSSLWTARAIGYRARNGIAPDAVALAVVVQAMVEAEASGVLFTANPLTGKRGEVVVDATFGLGEALVSGQVEPDHFVVDPDVGRIVARRLGAKALAIRSAPDGGTVIVQEASAERQALPDDALLALAAEGRRIEALFGDPQDIEWALAGGALYIVQSRPITSLYPLPEGLPAEPLQVLFSFGAVQGALDPFTPLGRDMIAGFFAGMGRRLGRNTTIETQGGLLAAGERLFVNVTPLLRFPRGRHLLRTALPLVEPDTAGLIEEILDDPRLAPTGGGPSPRTLAAASGVLGTLLTTVAYNLVRPDAGRVRVRAFVEAEVERVRQRVDQARTLEARLALPEAFLASLPHAAVNYLLPAVMTGIGSLRALHSLARAWPEGARDVLEATRGLPYNVTTEMDLSLWATAQAIRVDQASSAAFAAKDAAALAEDYEAGALPPVAQRALAGFLARYGERGVGEIDFGRPRWRDDPTQLLQVLASYLRIEDPALAPDAVFARGAAAAEAALDRLARAARLSRGGWWRGPLVRWLGWRMRALAGLRETPKFFIVRGMGITREGLLAAGEELGRRGVLERADDVFFLRHAELAGAAAAGPELRERIAERRARFEAEARRTQVPRLLLSDGTTYYTAEMAEAGAGPVLAGSPVSPGAVEGPVRVVFDPRGVALDPGDILVCPGTDPAWTPLFLAAGGLVMEVGGLMTHGSVVAREYGIPAVVGVAQATTRLHTGERVRVDGSAGTVTILSEPSGAASEDGSSAGAT